MRRSLRQLAAIKPTRFLEPNTPTGLTGLLTHPAPRSTLIYFYTSTLEKLKAFPEQSLYRQSTEAVLKHRLQIVESAVPEGWQAWTEKVNKTVEEHPEVFKTPEGGVAYMGGKYTQHSIAGREFIEKKFEKEVDDTTLEWDGEKGVPELEGTRSPEERTGQASLIDKRPGEDLKHVELDPEPPLSAEQIGDIENKIGAGLIEEVIQVAEGELVLADVMLNAQVWEDLEEKPVEGQWTYFMRDTATGTTTPPPQK